MHFQQKRIILYSIMLRNLFIFICLLFACAITAQQPYFKNYQVRDGLPSNNVYFVFQDSKGYIWLCTDIGVSRFDGLRFTNFTTADGLSDNEVFTCYEDRSGRIWFATLNGKPCFIKDGIIHNEKNTPLLDNINLGGTVFNIFEEENGEVIFASNLMFGRLDFSKNKASTSPFPLPVVQAWPANGDTLGLLSDSIGVGYSLQGKFIKTGNFKNLIKPVKLGQLNDTIYITSTRNLLIYNNLTQKIISFTHFPASMNEVITVNPVADRLWVGSRSGAYLFDRHNLQLRKVYLPDSQVSAILEDREGGWWFSTLEDGVFYTPAPEILQILDADGNSPGQVNCLSADPTGRLWLGLPNNNFGSFENGKLTPLMHFPKGLTPRAISSIRQLPDGSTLIVGKAGMTLVKNGRNQFILLRSTDVNMDAEGNFWSGLTGLFRVPKEKIHLIFAPNKRLEEAKVNDYYKNYKPEKLSKIRVDRIVFDHENTAWLGTPNGLFFYKNQMSDAVLPHNIRDLIFDKKSNTLWALTESKGLFALRNGQVLDSIGIASAGQSPKICRDFCQDAKGSFWVATASGLMKVEGEFGNLKLLDFSNVHGLGAEKLNAVEVIGEQVFLGKDDGLVAVPFSIFAKKLLPPPIHLKRLMVNEQERSLGQSLHLSAHENSVSFSFEGLSFKDYKKLQYRYRLIGLDDDWHITNNEAVQYASLRPGHYRFEVVAVNSSGVSSEQAASFEFSIARPFWWQWWFIGLAVAAITGMVFLWVKWREQKLRRTYEFERRLMTAENEKLELQSKNADLKMLSLRLQMNPHFIFNALNTIKGYYGQEKITQANSYIAKFARLLRLNLDYSDSYIPLDQELELLKIYLQLSQIRYPDKLDFELEIGPDIIPSAVRIPSMVIQPFVENAVIHGIVGKDGKGHISVAFMKAGSELMATIRDNGMGRKASSAKSMLRDPHKPLATSITTERLDLLRKKTVPPSVDIRDIYGENGLAVGTEVVLHLPLEYLKN
jgi:ligand-binding sensor domain-containing protein